VPWVFVGEIRAPVRAGGHCEPVADGDPALAVVDVSAPARVEQEDSRWSRLSGSRCELDLDRPLSEHQLTMAGRAGGRRSP
jgi:hypothetical protein